MHGLSSDASACCLETKPSHNGPEIPFLMTEPLQHMPSTYGKVLGHLNVNHLVVEVGVEGGCQTASVADRESVVLVFKTLGHEPLQERCAIVSVDAKDLLLSLGGIVLQRRQGHSNILG